MEFNFRTFPVLSQGKREQKSIDLEETAETGDRVAGDGSRKDGNLGADTAKEQVLISMEDTTGFVNGGGGRGKK